MTQLYHDEECSVGVVVAPYEPGGIRMALDQKIAANCCKTAAPVGVSGPEVTRRRIRFGSGTGTRTPNLAVNRLLHSVQKWRSEFAECRYVPPSALLYDMNSQPAI